MRILLGMSGGLDSTYAALQLKNEGHTVEGAFIKMHQYAETDEAVSAAKGLGIPLHIINAEEQFENCVVNYFVSEYRSGRTPNPCVVCNSEVKFRILCDYAKEHGFDKIATGHYAKVVEINTDDGTRYALSCSKDTKKDQTYMLWRLPQDILAMLYLPLYDIEKKEVRENAKNAGMLAADREESQEICFIPSGDYATFIEERTSPSPHGNFIDSDGKILGEHLGIIRYTVGQRKGLGIAMGQRVFVTDINPVENTVTLSSLDSHGDVVTVSGMMFSAAPNPPADSEISLFVKLRYLAPKIPCTLKYLGNGEGKVFLDSPVRAVTPGQSAVFYDAEGVLTAGGFIVSSELRKD